MEFNGSKPSIMCLDVNSCFATIEQQANPFLRDKPVCVCAYTTPSGTVLAASVTAKKMGIKTGMRVWEAKKICSSTIFLLPDPPKYRFVHKQILKILKKYSPNVVPKSIDEFIFNIVNSEPWTVAKQIKKDIKNFVGEYITVSIGISTNRYLAKIASDRVKPDGLVEINKNNFLEIFSKMKLTDLKGIKTANALRLKKVGISSVIDFYEASIWKLKISFGGIGGLYWHTRLHGYEVDNFKSTRKTYGNSYAPPPNLAHQKLEILNKLCQKTGARLRHAGLGAGGVHLSILFRRQGYWHKSMKTKNVIFEDNDIYKEILKLLEFCPITDLPRILAINVFNLSSLKNLQLNIFSSELEKYNLATAIDFVNKKFGDFTIHYAKMSSDPTVVQDRISFGQL